jgi:ribosome biogenesis GTPase / thiamine phosphate phosphatase
VSVARRDSARGVLLAGRIVASHGRSCLVEIADGEILECVNRGKRGGLACGDRVAVAPIAAGQGVIERVEPRMSLVYRSDPFREKLIAANITQVVMVVAGRPSFSEALLNRCLVAAEWQQLRVLILLNKCDLAEATHDAAQALQSYRRLGYLVLPISARLDISPLLPLLADQSSVLVGQTGMGKSTLINALVPGACAQTGELSEALGSGRHTTTHTRLYRLEPNASVIDSPGMQEFGLHHLTGTDIAHAFPEFRPYFGRCRFNDCRHMAEPGCALAQAAERSEIDPRRLEFYRGMLPMARAPRNPVRRLSPPSGQWS